MGLFDKLERRLERDAERMVVRDVLQGGGAGLLGGAASMLGLGGMMGMGAMAADAVWPMAGQMFDPYSHGQMMFDPSMNHHGVMLNGLWHPLEMVAGAWMFAHPSSYNLPYNYQPASLQPPQYAMGGAPPAPTAAGMPCANCQAIMPWGTKFCLSCGTPMATPPAPVSALAGAPCAKCQAIVPTGTKFCLACGTAVPVAAPVAPPAPVVAAPIAAEGVPCVNCQALVPDGHKFCMECGTPVAAPPAAAPQVIACAQCGQEIAGTAKFCPHCGHPRA